MTTATTGDILDALKQAMAPIEEGMTVWEMAEALGRGRQGVYNQVRRLVLAGRMRHVVVNRQQMNGRWKPTDGYQVVKSKRK